MNLPMTDLWRQNARSITVRKGTSCGATLVSHNDRFFVGGYAQVATSVPHAVVRKSCGLKPKRIEDKKSISHSVRFQSGELAIVRSKAQIAGITTNSYIRASVLGSDYKPPIDPELKKRLLAINRELTAQGNNLNQIAKYLHTEKITADQVTTILDSIRVPLVTALQAVKNALVKEAQRN